VKHPSKLGNPANREVIGTKFLKEMKEKMLNIKQNLKASQDRNKIYADKNITYKEFKVGDQVFLKVKDNTSSMKLGNCSKLASKYCGSFEILERIGPIAYVISFPSCMHVHKVFHVSLLKKYIPDVNHVIDWNVIHMEK
jgi:hypothetical protein